MVCLAACSPPCQNGGTCVAPNTCECVPGFAGDACEILPLAEMRCGKDPATPRRSSLRMWEDDRRLFSCEKGYTLNVEGNSLLVECRNNTWVYLDRDAYQAITCVPICQPTCANGGRCVAPNTCHCELAFKGRTCNERTCIGQPPEVRRAITVP
nr:von Willebrand factor D and EGF domain-containing protein-like [Procambarus clarkii]